MASLVQVVVEAKDAASGVLRGITTQMGKFGSVVEQVTGSSINWGNVAAQSADLIVDTVKEAIKVTQEYAAEVRDLSLASGTTAEEASRLLDVLGNFEITANDVTAATKVMTKNGLAPTIETIADLSDKYVTLNSAQEKNKFIIDNLGRGGLQWANALQQGGDALRALNEEVPQALILGEEQIQQYEEYRMNLDALNDNWLSLQVTLANSVVPVLNDVFNLFNEINQAQAALEAQGSTPYEAHRMALMGFTTEAELAADAADGLAEATRDAGNAAANSVPDYAKQLSMIQKLTDATEEQIKAVAYQQLQAQLAEGGITEEENQLLEQAGIAMGIFDQNAVDAAHSINELNRRLADGELKLYTYISLLESIPTNINTTVTTTTSTVTTATGSIARQQGGEVYAGSPVMVGERGREPFMPAQDGRILGHAESLHALSMGSGGGTNYFYGNVTLQIDETAGNGILEYR